MTPDELRLAHEELRDRLIAAGLLLPTGVPGLYGRSAVFEQVIAAIDRSVRAAGAADEPVVVDYPPIIPRDTFDRIGYLRNFPQLVGPVYSFEGGEREHAQLVARLDAAHGYSDLLQQSEVALTPATCYPVYPSCAGTVAPGGRLFEVSGYCFRHEPSPDPMRLQSFRQREHVRIGTPDEVLDWRASWLERVPKLLGSFGLDVHSDVANDPFFGRGGRLMAHNQREQQLKIEFLVPVHSADHPTACSSINYHQDHFGDLFGMHLADGSHAHSGCIGVGFERCAVAMFAAHGTAVDRWPESVRSVVWP